jgi:hypothetical protein
MSLYDFIKYNNCVSWLSLPSIYDKMTLHDNTINGTITEYLLVNGLKAAYFNGSSYINSFNYTLASPFTVSVWFNIPSTPTVQNTLYDSADADSTDKIMLYVSTTNVLHAKIVSTSSLVKEITYTIQNGQWYHAVMTRSGTHLYLYINGILVNSVADTLPFSVQTQFAVGKNVAGVSSYYLTGYIKNLMVFSQVLSTKQIQKLYYYTYIS